MAPRRKPGIEVREGADGTRSYRIRWRQDGRYLSHTFDREKLAVDARNRIAAAGWVCHCPAHAPVGVAPAERPGDAPGAITFGTYARRHADALTGVGEGYRRDVRRDLAKHLRPFADRPLDDISYLEVREWVRGMESGSHWWLHRESCDRHATQGELPCSQDCNAVRSTTTIRRVLAQASGAMRAAMDDGAATRNPFRGHRLAERHVEHGADQIFLTEAEWQLLASHLPEGVYRDFATVLVGTGLRWGEAAALTVGAVDVLADPPRLHVAQAWKKNGKGGVVLGPPKSRRSRRTVPYSSWVRDALIPHVAGKDDDEFVFTTPSGRPLLHSNFYGKVWQPAVARAQAARLTKRPRVHDLRHTYVSWMLAEGRSLSEVSRRVGHQSIHLTDARYSHLLPDADAQSAAALERYRPNSRGAE